MAEPTSLQELPDYVNMKVTTSSEFALRGLSNKIKVLFEIKTDHPPQDQEPKKRRPLNLAIVLDRSGSMRGDKLTNAKKAICKVIQNLGTEDVLHFVVYDSKVQTIFQNASVTKETRSSLQTQVKAIKPKGMTNLWGGVSQAAELIKEHNKEGATKRIFLFSDGIVNKGVKKSTDIHEMVSDLYHSQDVKVSAFGLGEDFDEDLMRNIAEFGTGTYFFIEGASAIVKFVDFALTGLLKAIGSDTKLKIRGKNSATLTKIYGHKDLVQGALLDDLKQDNSREVVAVLEVKPTEHVVEEELLTWELSYVPSALNDEKPSNERVVGSGVVTIKYTDDEDTFNSSMNVNVEVAEALQIASEIDAEVITLLDSKKTDEAVESQERQITMLKALVEKDESGRVKALLEQTESALANLKKEGNSRKVRKQVQHQGYMKRRASIGYTAGYCSFD